MPYPVTRRIAMRIAVVDIGSNSTRLLIADVEDGRVVEELERRSTVTRLGDGVDANGELKPEAMDRVCRTLDEYGELIEQPPARAPDRRPDQRCPRRAERAGVRPPGRRALRPERPCPRWR